MTQQDLTDYASEGGGSSAARYVPGTCIGFDVTADFAHFRKAGNNSAKPSYRVPPRTTIAGLLAGIMGMPRDSYYDLFSPSSSAVAVVPKELPHTYTMGITTVNTKPDAILYLPEEKYHTKSAEMLTPESYVKYDRQRDTYEMLVDPAYRVYVALADEDVHGKLREHLEESRYHYSPALGLSECIADIRNVDTYMVESATTDAVDSAAYDDSAVVLNPVSRSSANGHRSIWRRQTTDGGRPSLATSRTRLATTASR